MSILIFLAYLIFFSWIITRIRFFTATGINYKILIALFLLKVVAGIAYGWFYQLPQYNASSDTWYFYNESLKETDLLLKDPFLFIKTLFSHNYQNSGNIFSGVNSYWNDLKTNLIIKIEAVINVFTGSRYFVNVIFFNFLFFFGPVALYRVFTEHKCKNCILLIAGVFCIPSFIFWYSGAHKDGLIFAATALTIFYADKLLKHFRLSYLFAILVFLLFLFAFRNYLIVLLLPAFLVWYIFDKYFRKKGLAILVVYGTCLMVFFASQLLPESVNLPLYIVSKHDEFKSLEGSSQLYLPELHATTTSFLQYLPYAADIAFLRPHLTEFKNVAYIPAIFENILLWLILFAVAIQIGKQKEYFKRDSINGFIIFCYCFGISLLLLSGYIVTLTGAIVRYKAFALPFIITPLLQHLPFKSKNQFTNI